MMILDITKTNKTLGGYMQYLRHSWIVILSLLAIGVLFTKCNSNIIKSETEVEKSRSNTILNEHSLDKTPKILYPRKDDAVVKTKKVEIEKPKNLVQTKEKADDKSKELENINAFKSQLDEANQEVKKERELSHKLLDERKREIESLKEKLAHDESELKRLTSQRDSFKTKLEEFKTSQRDLVLKEGSHLKEDIKKLQEEVKNERETSKKMIDDKTREIDKLQNNLSHAKSRLERALEDRRSIKDEFSAYKKEQRDDEKGLKEKFVEAGLQIVAIKKLVSKKDERLNLLSSKADDEKKYISSLKESKIKLEEEVKELESSLEKSEIKLKEKDTKIAELLDEKDGQKDTLSAVTTEVKEQLNALEKDITSERETSKQILEDKKSEIDRLKDEITNINDKNAKAFALLQEKINEGEKIKKVQKLKDEDEAKRALLQTIADKFKLSKIEFKTGSATLTNKSKELLDEVATIIKKHSDYNYNIQGHTDSRGNEKLNIILSQNRAKSVKDYLISQKVDEKILSYEGFGSSSPIADNATRAGRVQNRRVVFEIVD